MTVRAPVGELRTAESAVRRQVVRVVIGVCELIIWNGHDGHSRMLKLVRTAGTSGSAVCFGEREAFCAAKRACEASMRCASRRTSSAMFLSSSAASRICAARSSNVGLGIGLIFLAVKARPSRIGCRFGSPHEGGADEVGVKAGDPMRTPMPRRAPGIGCLDARRAAPSPSGEPGGNTHGHACERGASLGRRRDGAGGGRETLQRFGLRIALKSPASDGTRQGERDMRVSVSTRSRASRS